LSADIIDGKAVAGRVLEEVKEDVKTFSEKYRPPHLAVIIVGDNPASRSYVRSKVKKAQLCGVKSTLIELPANVSQDELEGRIEKLNSDREIDGILVQLPLPDHINQQDIIKSVSPLKDVDGFHPENIGLLASDTPRFVPCTPLGIHELLKSYDVEIDGKHVVIIGRSLIVGKPLALLLAQRAEGFNATVTICHSRSRGLVELTRSADILVSAVGRPGMVGADMVKSGAVVIDVGINRVDDPGTKKGYRLVGDVDFEAVSRVASLITPVPGGVGPMTVAMLMKNTLHAATLARNGNGTV